MNMKLFLLLSLIFMSNIIFAIEEITLPEITIRIDDLKEFNMQVGLDLQPNIYAESFDLLKPELSEAIKIDLEHTLPEAVIVSGKMKPVDASVKFGYGLNNAMMTDFSMFIKDFNPIIGIRYSRFTRDNYWHQEKNRRVFYSSDKFESDITYTYSLFTLNSSLGYQGTSYSLQNQSIYSDQAKKTMFLDLNPFLRFDSRNNLSLMLQNSFLFNNLSDGFENPIDYKNDFDYLFRADLIYSLVLSQNHYVNFFMNYDFSYLSTETEGRSKNSEFGLDHLIKTGGGYEGSLADSWTLKLDFAFQGQWKGEVFYWFLLPELRLGYNFKEYFSAFLQGGGASDSTISREWFTNVSYNLYPLHEAATMKWFGKAGVGSAIFSFFNVFSDLTFSYYQRGQHLSLSSEVEKLFTLYGHEFFSLMMSHGVSVGYRQFVNFSLIWSHEFLDISPYESGDILLSRLDLAAPSAGLSCYAEFEARFRRSDYRGKQLENLFLLNAGADWNFQERFGMGVDFKNIIDLKKYTYMSFYYEPGFEFMIYLKAGF